MPLVVNEKTPQPAKVEWAFSSFIGLILPCLYETSKRPKPAITRIDYHIGNKLTI